MTMGAYAPPAGGGRGVVKVPNLARIRAWRLLTQAELAAKSGVAAVTLSRLENGSEANARTVRKLARALEVSPYDLMGLDPNRPPSTDL